MLRWPFACWGALVGSGGVNSGAEPRPLNTPPEGWSSYVQVAHPPDLEGEVGLSCTSWGIGLGRYRTGCPLDTKARGGTLGSVGGRAPWKE